MQTLREAVDTGIKVHGGHRQAYLAFAFGDEVPSGGCLLVNPLGKSKVNPNGTEVFP